jgi:hypothetical protein
MRRDPTRPDLMRHDETRQDLLMGCDMKTFTATLKSTSPISFGRYYAQDVPKKDRESAADYEERTWRERLHVADDGRIFIPPFAFKNCLDSAAKYLGKQIPGKGKNTFTKHFASGVLVMDPLVLSVKKTEVKGEWRYVPADGMPGGSKRVMKCFPVVPKWEGNVEIQVLDDTVTSEVLEEHLVQAGQFIGVGSFRPQNRGIYGRFRLVSLKEKKRAA